MPSVERDTASGSEDDSIGENEEGWEDVEPDNEAVAIQSLFDERKFDNVKAVMEYCKENYDFDLLAVRRRLQLDFLGTIKLINYIRSEAARGNSKPDISSSGGFSDEKYLKPVIEDDALLYSLDDLEDEDEVSVAPTNSDGSTQATQRDTNQEIQDLQEELASLRAQFAAYKEEVQKALQPRLEEPRRAPANTSNPDIEPPTAIQTARNEYAKAEQDYFESYSYNSIHETMLKDTVRTDAYRNFIYDNKDLFAGKVVLDVGCGTGILSMFCAKAGAKMVIAVDNSVVLEKARENVFNNGMQDVIKCLRGKVEEIVLPVNKVDVIVSEWMGYCLLYESMLDSVIWARDHYLSPDGLMVPSHAILKIGALGDSDFRESHIDFWRDVYGFDMTAMLSKVYDEAIIRTISGGDVVSEFRDEAFNVLDLHTVSIKDLDFVVPFGLHPKQPSPAYLEGFVVWFLIGFARARNTGYELAMAFDTGPGKMYTHWQQTVLLLDTILPFDKLPSGHCSQKLIEGKIQFRKMTTQERSLEVGVTLTTADGKREQQWLLD